jgi:uncharacterized protein (DUF1015 family)
MATIRPFRGVRYDPGTVGDLSSVVSQPHDRVRHGLQDEYYKLSPYNVARLIKGKAAKQDDEGSNPAVRAAECYQAWLRDGILRRDGAPCLYVLRQTFKTQEGLECTRQGVMAALELTEFDKGIVLPHERTLQRSMADRMALLRATSVNFGAVFMLYPGSDLGSLLAPATSGRPTVEVRELHERDVLQQLWVVDDPDVVGAVVEEMAPRRGLVIADGHHRYETALQYRDEIRSRYPEAPASAAFNYRLVTLVGMEDPGLVILPTHRLVRCGDYSCGAGLLERAEEYFEVTSVEGPEALGEALHAANGSSSPVFGFHDGRTALLILRDQKVMGEIVPDHSPTWRTLNVSVLHELFLERVVGLTKEEVAADGHIEFLRDAQMGYESVARREADFIVVMNPTRIEQVRDCSAAGERMPQKSTDFYPKIISGLVMFPVGAGERV